MSNSELTTTTIKVTKTGKPNPGLVTTTTTTKVTKAEKTKREKSDSGKGGVKKDKTKSKTTKTTVIEKTLPDGTTIKKTVETK